MAAKGSLMQGMAGKEHAGRDMAVHAKANGGTQWGEVGELKEKDTAETQTADV